MRTEIGRWRLGEILGEGGMGTVYLAHHETLETPAAAKLLSPKLTRDPKFRERFLREAKAQAQLHHPGIARVLDFIEDGEDLCIVVEYLPGGTLAAQLDGEKPLPVETALTWARQALEALDYANQRGIIHRDVKPSNIMLDEHERAKVVDFGIALVLDGRRLTTATGSMGTPHYMSPEQIRRPKEVDHRTDVYSMGVVLYEMLAGRPPFNAESDYDLQAAQVNEPPKPLREINPDVPEEIEAVALQALEKNPDGRFPGCGAFARALQAAQETKVEVVVVEPPPLPPPSRNLKRLTVALGAAAILALGAISWQAGELKKERGARSSAESSLTVSEQRADALHELAVAKSWPLALREDFDLFSSGDRPFPFFVGPNESALAKEEAERRYLTYRWRFTSLKGFISTHGAQGVSQSEGETIYLSAELKQVVGSANTFGALMFRSSDGEYYSFELRKNSYGLSHTKAQTHLIDWTSSSAIRPGVMNRLAVIADASRIQLFINDEKVGEISDSTTTSGQVGLAAGAYSAGQSATIDFDNFELRKRPSGG